MLYKNKHILSLQDGFISDKGNVCIVTDYCALGTVESMFEQSGPVSADQAFNITIQIASGLSALHRDRILHRDLKPDNVLVKQNAEGNLYILGDLGLSMKLQENEDCAETPFGHMLYMAPETGIGRQSFAGDMWSLGCMCLELITGKTLKGRYEDKKLVLNKLTQKELDVFVAKILRYLLLCTSILDEV